MPGAYDSSGAAPSMEAAGAVSHLERELVAKVMAREDAKLPRPRHHGPEDLCGEGRHCSGRLPEAA